MDFEAISTFSPWYRGISTQVPAPETRTSSKGERSIFEQHKRESVV